MNERDLLFLVLGLNAGFFGRSAFQVSRRRIWVWLWTRHEAVCTPLNQKWKYRIVRHPLTGRVGRCDGVCVQEQTWRDAMFPRWTAKVVFSPELAALSESKPQSLEEVLEIGMRAHHFAELGGVAKLPLRELALAPAADVAEFTKRKEEA